MDLKHAILDWIAKRDAALRDGEDHGGLRRVSTHGPNQAYLAAEQTLVESVAATNPLDASPLAEAARLWHAARRMAVFARSRPRHGTGPCPEILHALHAAEAVLHVVASGNPGLRHDDDAPPVHGHHLKKAGRPDDAAFEFVADNTDRWIIRDCEEEEGCSVVERLHRQEVVRATAEDRDPEPVQVIDVPPDLCGLVGRALVLRASRVSEQKRRSGPA